MTTILERCRQRFSVRKFTDEPVSNEELNYILEAARLAPSAVNRQPWKFVIVASDYGKAMLRACYDREWFKSATLYIICMKNVEENWIRPADGKAHGDIDVAIATEHMCLAAAERNLGTCWVCNYDVAKLAACFPEEHCEAVAIIPVGHVAADCPCPMKKRKTLESIVVRV